MGALSSIMDIGHAAGPFCTGINITAAGYTLEFATSFLLAIAVTAGFTLSVRGNTA